MNVPPRLLLLELKVDSKKADRKSYLVIGTPSPGGHLLHQEEKVILGDQTLQWGNSKIRARSLNTWKIRRLLTFFEFLEPGMCIGGSSDVQQWQDSYTELGRDLGFKKQGCQSNMKSLPGVST